MDQAYTKPVSLSQNSEKPGLQPSTNWGWPRHSTWVVALARAIWNPRREKTPEAVKEYPQPKQQIYTFLGGFDRELKKFLLSSLPSLRPEEKCDGESQQSRSSNPWSILQSLLYSAHRHI